MKLLCALLLLPISGFAAGPSPSKEMQENYVRAIDRFNVGVQTRTDVAEARLAYIDASFAAAEMTKTQYCYEATEAANLVVLGIQAELSVGQRTQKEYVDASVKKNQVEDLCSKK